LYAPDGELALLSWSAKACNGARACDGADTFLIRDGRIVGETIHYGLGRPTMLAERTANYRASSG
jgi:hypothetical protein